MPGDPVAKNFYKLRPQSLLKSSINVVSQDLHLLVHGSYNQTITVLIPQLYLGQLYLSGTQEGAPTPAMRLWASAAKLGHCPRVRLFTLLGSARVQRTVNAWQISAGQVRRASCRNSSPSRERK